MLAAWGLAMILPGLYRVVEPFAAFGLSADNDGVIVDIVSPFETASQSPAAMAGIVPGDRIDLSTVQCWVPSSRACANAVVVLGGFGGLQYTLPGQQLDLTTLPLRGGPPRNAHLEATLAPLSWSAKLVLLADTVVGVLFVVSAFYLVWTRPSGMTWGFFLYAIWFNPGQSYAYYAFLQ